MTISYQFNVATASFAGFPRLLCRWKGSVYKLVFKEVLVFVSLYAVISTIYRCGLSDEQKRSFEQLCLHMQVNIDFIPLTFVLGFYVSFVVGRWWDQFSSYPWPDRLCYLIILYINGSDEKSRMIRRTLVRYLNASTVLLTRSVSIVAKKRFPTFEHLVEAGLLTPDEFKTFQNVEVQLLKFLPLFIVFFHGRPAVEPGSLDWVCQVITVLGGIGNMPLFYAFPWYAKFWVPLVWFTQLVDKTRKEGLFHDPSGGMKQVMDELMAYRDRQGKIWAYDYVSIPIVYTQVVTLATYMYFVGCLFSRQFLEPSQKYENYYVDIYVPVFTLLQFFFYVGWLKVAESLINPWGEDDDDFEVNWFIDRHMQVSYAMVDDMYGQLPPMEKDKYWNERDVVLPYTLAAMETKKKPDFSHLGSTMNLDVPVSARPMRRPSATEAALGSSADLVMRRRHRKTSRQEELLMYLPRNHSTGVFEEISIAVPDNPYGLRKAHVESDSEGSKAQSDKYLDKTVKKENVKENGYLTPGCPVVPPDVKQEDRFRKISSPARMKFFQPDKEAIRQFNARMRTISDNSAQEEAENAKPPDDVETPTGENSRPNSAQKTDSSEPLLSPDTDSSTRLA